MSIKVANGSLVQHKGTIPGRLGSARFGSARLTCDYNAISVQLQLQLPTGTELGKNMLLTRYVRMKTTDKKLDQLLNHLHRLINAKFVGSLLGLAKH